jgi:hypothetical protein
MKTAITLLSLTLVCLAPLCAEPPAEARPTQDSQTEARPTQDRQNETRMLHHLLEMDQEDLTALRKTIERIERMTPEEKTLLRERINKLETMKPERLEIMRKHFDAIDPEVRDAMHQRWLEMSSDERRSWRKKLHDIPEEERINLLTEQGFLPTPGKPPKGPRPPRSDAE